MHAETRMYEVEIVSNRRSKRYGELKSNFAHTAHHAQKIDKIGKIKDTKVIIILNNFVIFLI